MKPDGSIAASDLAPSDEALHALPQAPAVFLVSAESGRPYLARTSLLRRRALRLLAHREGPSRIFNLRQTFQRLDYWLAGSALDSSMRMYELARLHFPEDYARILRLRFPPYLKLLLSNDWPRAVITTHLNFSSSLIYGPFRNRATAEQFQSELLDLFQLRRCQENLEPSAAHPGCIYGEVRKCLRPCQLAVTHEEYASEVSRAGEFLRTSGASMIKSIAAARDTLSSEMEFEEAARQHRRLERVEEVLRFRDEFAFAVDHLHAAAITRASAPNAVDVFFLRDGFWQDSARIGFELEDGKPVSLDRKLRETFAAVPRRRSTARERQERLAVFARWFYSTWRDGELLIFPAFEEPPIRKLVNAISRVMERD